MAFKEGWDEDEVRAHHEVSCITIFKTKFPEEETCWQAQIERNEINPALSAVLKNLNIRDQLWVVEGKGENGCLRILRPREDNYLSGSLLKISSSAGNFEFRDVVLGVYGDV